ncbi:MAG: protein kinase [Pirellulaceae bacterium]
MSLRDIKPGRYKPQCRECQRKFVLTIPDPTPIVRTLAEDKELAEQDAQRSRRHVIDAEKTAPPHSRSDKPHRELQPTLAHQERHASRVGSQSDHDTVQQTSAFMPMEVEQLQSTTLPHGDSSDESAVDSAVESVDGALGGLGDATLPPDAQAERSATRGFDATELGATTGVAPSQFDAAHPDAAHPDDAHPAAAEAGLASIKKTAPLRSERTAAADATEVYSPKTTAEATDESTSAGADRTEIYQGDAAKAEDLPADAPRNIGGYKIVRELGRGAMGAVYLARQVSLDRKVALKVIQPRMAKDPVFISRFTREAYAAAQLTHHNIVQVYDLGASAGNHYFSMEFVEGRPLTEVVHQQGRLSAEAAVGYVLQAARGLHFAHEHGMVHRDIKPDNLLLNDRGIVKVADLGLVKTRGAGEDGDGKAAETTNEQLRQTIDAEQTIANVAMGTPAYMPPEQAEDAAHVDHRADIYSLGCTLYVLLTGRPPFQGASALEVITKHKSEPMVRPEAVVKRVPPQLSEINMQMVAKRPEDRQPDMGRVIEQLEGFLGVRSGGDLSPSEENMVELERSVALLTRGKWRGLRPKLLLGFFALCGVLFAAGAALLNGWLLGGGIGLAVMTTVAYFVLSGLLDRTYLLAKVREMMFASRWTDYLLWTGGAALALLMLYLFGLLLPTAIWLVMSVGVAAGFYFVVDRRVSAERRAAVDQAEQLLKRMRLRGPKEESLQQFVARFAGADWEEMFEALFGYEAKIEARQWRQPAPSEKKQKTYRAWRDPIVERIDARIAAIRQARERRHLQKLEQAALEAKGVDRNQAREEALDAADAMVDQAAVLRQVARTPSTAETAANKRAMVKNMLAATRSEGQRRKQSLGGRIRAALQFAFGGKVRFAAGAALLTVCLLWLNQNGLVPGAEIRDAVTGGAAVSELRNLTAEQKLAMLEQMNQPADTQPVAFLPSPLNAWLSNFNTGLAGVILLVSIFFRGPRAAGFALVAALAAVFVPILASPYLSLVPAYIFPADSILRPGDIVGMTAGGLIALVGVLVLRRSSK